jgi:hypothetical protein
MSPKAIPTITVMHLKFDVLARRNDQAIIKQMVITERSSKKRLLPKSVKYDRHRVSRSQNLITIHLCLGEVETARFSFAPMPRILER